MKKKSWIWIGTIILATGFGAGIYFYRQTNDPKELIRQAEKLYHENKYNESVILYQEALYSLKKRGYSGSDMQASIYYAMGAAFYDMARYDDSIKYNNLAVNIFIKNKSPLLLNVYNNIAASFLEKRNYAKSKIYYLLALQIAEREKQRNIIKDDDIEGIYSNLAVCFSETADFPQAIIFYHKSLAIIPRIHGKDSEFESRTFYHLAETYFQTKDFSQSENFYLKALALADKGSESFRFKAVNSWGLSKIYQERGNHFLALKYANAALAHFKQCPASDPKIQEIVDWIKKQGMR